MSKYFVDKLMREVNIDENSFRAYVKDPAAFVEQWERTEGNELSPAERAALSQRDYEALYAMGAHPFLLWSFTQATLEHEVPREELVKRYKEKTAVVGYPDFTT